VTNHTDRLPNRVTTVRSSCRQGPRDAHPGRAAGVLTGLFTLLLLAIVPDAGANETHDGLVRQKGSELREVYLRAGADFSRYRGLLLQPVEVAFRRDFDRDTNQRLSSREKVRIKQDLAEEFTLILRDEFGTSESFHLTDMEAEDVLALRPAIINLTITAPQDAEPMGRAHTYLVNTHAGGGTLVLEVLDSVSGEILARIVDRRKTQRRSGAWRATRETNTRDARKLLSFWAVTLREGLESLRVTPGK